jgi:transglutaminase-like putative cysteine protease
MNSTHSKHILIFLLSSIGLIVLPHIANIPIALFVFFNVMLGLRFIVIWRPQYLPNSRILFVLTLVAVALLLSLHRGVFGRDSGTNLFILALGLKLLEIKTERDIYLVAYLAFIVAASLFLYEQSLFMAAYILAVCCVLLATLVSINSIQQQTLANLKIAAVLILQAIPIAAALFILFPRVEAPRWMLLEDKNKTAKTGLSDSMEMGSISDLGMSPELVFRVKFTGQIPPAKERYWRGPVLSYTDGKHWTQLSSQRFRAQLDKPNYTGSPYSYTLLMETQEKNWVFALDLPAQFSRPLVQNGYYQLSTLEDPSKRAEYQITSYAQYNTGYLTKTESRDSIQLPDEPSEQIKQLVTQLHGFDGKPEEFIAQLLNYFKTEGFYYTLTPPLMEDKPIETFLFKTRYGFCSHYAATFVYLMRVAHIPARVVTGYQGGELNPVGDFLEIRQANAHAWTEVWLENKGWVRVDPTAAIANERIEQQPNPEQLAIGEPIRFDASNSNQLPDWLTQSRQLWDNADYQWQRWVVNYNRNSQSNFLSTFGIYDFKAMMKWLMIVLSLITVLLSAFLLQQKQKAIDPVLRLYQQFCNKLQTVGLSRNAGEGAVDFAQRAKAALPEQAQAIETITATFMRIRYGSISTQDDVIRLAKLVAEFKLN